jgi:hypothetical protein
MKRISVLLVGVILIMNITNAFGEVSYRTVRVDDLDIFYREDFMATKARVSGDTKVQ